ncbi:hypothetical protein [Shigella sonnei]
MSNSEHIHHWIKLLNNK